MLASINWRLVFRHVIPAVYVPVAALIAFAIVVAITGLGTNPYVNHMGPGCGLFVRARLRQGRRA